MGAIDSLLLGSELLPELGVFLSDEPLLAAGIGHDVVNGSVGSHPGTGCQHVFAGAPALLSRLLPQLSGAIGVFVAEVFMRAALAVVLATVLVRAASGQSPAETFEVASVKPNLSGAPGASSSTPPAGTIAITNTQLKSLIVNSYRVRPFQVVGAPSWTETERFDILAKPPAGATPDQLPAMMRELLATRFGLRAHMKTSEQPIYALTRLRADGRLGPQLTQSAFTCTGAAPPVNAAGANPCRSLMSVTDAGGRIEFVGRPLSSILDTLGIVTNRVVVDQTTLTGPMDLRLEWSSDSFERPAGVGAPPSIFTAVREQLGLRLESSRGQVEVLVIDSVSRPTPD